jgi:hypothetical protein
MSNKINLIIAFIIVLLYSAFIINIVIKKENCENKKAVFVRSDITEFICLDKELLIGKN